MDIWGMSASRFWCLVLGIGLGLYIVKVSMDPAVTFWAFVFGVAAGLGLSKLIELA